MKFKVGDKIDYGFFVNLMIIGEDDIHFILQDPNGNKRKKYKDLVNSHAKIKED